jgi:hypothetical protein
MLGVRTVSSSKVFREYSEECLGWARTARSDRERGIFLQMAQTWLEAAIRLEVGSAADGSVSSGLGLQSA